MVGYVMGSVENAIPEKRRNGLALFSAGVVEIAIAIYFGDLQIGALGVLGIAVGYLVQRKIDVGNVAFDWMAICSTIVALFGTIVSSSE